MMAMATRQGAITMKFFLNGDCIVVFLAPGNLGRYSGVAPDFGLTSPSQ